MGAGARSTGIRTTSTCAIRSTCSTCACRSATSAGPRRPGAATCWTNSIGRISTRWNSARPASISVRPPRPTLTASRFATSSDDGRLGGMKQTIGYVALVVRDYDEAIEFFVGTLDFVLIEDTFIESQNKRWVLVAPPGATECRL